MDSLLSIGVARKPGVFVGTRKPRTPSTVFVHTTATSATLASPIQRLRPPMIQSEPSRLAVVCIPAGSLPPVGSVRAKQPTRSPRAIGGSHSLFCSSEPNLEIALMASEPCTETKVHHPLSAASSSRQTKP